MIIFSLIIFLAYVRRLPPALLQSQRLRVLTRIHNILPFPRCCLGLLRARIAHNTLAHAARAALVLATEKDGTKLVYNILYIFYILFINSPLLVHYIIVELVAELKIVVGLVIELGQKGAHGILVTSNAAHDLLAAECEEFV